MLLPFLEHTASVQMLHVSPTGAYLLTWERLYADTCPRNLKVWSGTTGALLAAWPQKALSRESWPYLQWTTDERYAFLLMGNNQVRAYAASDIITAAAAASDSEEPRFMDKVQVQGCATLSLPQVPASGAAATVASRYYMTTFSPKTKNQPGSASIYEWSPPSSAATGSKFNRLAVKSLFQAESCSTYWSPSSANIPACLLTLQTAVDATGESYYGSSQLLLWNTEMTAANNNSEVLSVPLSGPSGSLAPQPRQTRFLYCHCGQNARHGLAAPRGHGRRHLYVWQQCAPQHGRPVSARSLCLSGGLW